MLCSGTKKEYSGEKTFAKDVLDDDLSLSQGGI